MKKMLLLLLIVLAVGRPGVIIENFESGRVALGSFAGEDAEPDSWILDTLVTHDSSHYSLALFGNTWKTESIAPVRLDSGDVWQVWAYVNSVCEIQGFGLADSANTLLYSLSGNEEVNPDSWVPVYQGAFTYRRWNNYQLPVAQDWLCRFGYLPTITSLVFVSDRDAGARGVVYYDDIECITADLPIAPVVEIWYEQSAASRAKATGKGEHGPAWAVTVRFHSRVLDPDSPWHSYRWLFGDGSSSTDSAPVHTYTVFDDHAYTVLLEVTDSTGRRGRATCRVEVDPGPTTFPLTISFVGDIMLARRYDQPGGIIDSIGPEGVFAPIKPWLDSADITVANLESPLTDSGTRHPTKPIVFRGRPTNVTGLAYAGIDVVSLANNHIIDYGLVGMRKTQRMCDSVGIAYSGAGANSYEAYLPLFWQARGQSIAFLAASDRNGQYDNYQPYLDAGYNKPGFAYLDSFHLREQIELVRDRADIVICELHTGEEYNPAPGELDSEDEMYCPWPRPLAPGDTAERHRLIEYGADAVICHHPHVLQGFEVYQGKLIAHSLGNFAFDLDYPETYRSAILTGYWDRRGFYDYRVVPVYIDDYIPRRATGELGRHILDDLARRSRDLGTYLITQPESVVGKLLLDTAGLIPAPVTVTATLPLDTAAGWSLSRPTRLRRAGSIARIESVTPAGNWQFRLGRELLPWGNCEDEGATMWSLGEPDEFYDTVSHRGSRSLGHRRTHDTTKIVTGLEERPTFSADAAQFSICAWVRTESTAAATVTAKFYATRTGSTPIATSALSADTGTTDWQFYYRDLALGTDTGFFNVELASQAPSAAVISRAWFDDISLVCWEPWQPLTGPVAITAPNDYYWIQLRTPSLLTGATVTYVENSYQPLAGVASGSKSWPRLGRLMTFPNPARLELTVQFELLASGPVTITIYDPLGRLVRVLAHGTRLAGHHAITWDRRDRLGRPVSPGTYFCQLQAGPVRQTAKLVLR